MPFSDLTQLGLLLTAVVTVLFAMHSHNRMMRSNLLLDFSRRYQEIMLAMPADESLAEKHILLYIDLCSEEYRLKEAMGIDGKTWLLWKDGMRCCFEHHPAFRRVWQAHRTEYGSDGFPQFMDCEILGDTTPCPGILQGTITEN